MQKFGSYEDVPSPLKLAALLAQAATASGFTIDELRGPRASRELVEIRRIFVKAAREQKFSLPTIGRALNRHHTSVLHLSRT